MRGENVARIIFEFIRDGDLFDLFAKVLLVPFSEWLVHFLELLKLFFGDFVVVEDVDIILGN